MSSDLQLFLLVSGLILVVTTLYILSLLWRCIRGAIGTTQQRPPRKPKKPAAAPPVALPPRETYEAKERGQSLKDLIKQSAQANRKPQGDTWQASHPHLFVNTLKGHADAIVDLKWSHDGRSIITACEDMMVRVFNLHDPTNNNLVFKQFKVATVPLGVAFGDSVGQVVVLRKGIANRGILTMMEHKVLPSSPKPSWEQSWEVQDVHGKEAAMSLASVAQGQAAGMAGVIVSCSAKKEARIFSILGKELARVEPNSLANHNLALSLNGRFISIASFTADVKIWELKYTKEGFRGVEKVMDLKGHNSAVFAVAYDRDSRRAVAASKDVLIAWNIDVRYNVNEDPRVLFKRPYRLPKEQHYTHLAMCGDVIAASFGGGLHFLRGSDGELLEAVPEAHDTEITALRWSPVPLRAGSEPEYLLATASRDKRARVWRAPM